jgi:Domain of unknown function (DUF4129)
MRGRAAAVALSALVVALVAVVAIASTGSTPGGTEATRPPSETLYDTIFTLMLIAVGIGGVLLVYGLAQRKAIAAEVASGRYRRTGIVGYLAFFGIFTAVTYWRLSEWDGPPAPDEEGELAFPGQIENLPTLPEGAESSYEPSVSWIPLLVVAALVVGGVAAYVVAERRAAGGRGRSEVELARQLADVLDDTLDDLLAEADPRRAVIAAYARLERVLAANGTDRQASETADEYLPRVLHDLEIDPLAVGRLTELYREAKFSHHVVGPAMKDEAIGALEVIRDELRGLRKARAVPDHEASTPAGATS